MCRRVFNVCMTTQHTPHTESDHNPWASLRSYTFENVRPHLGAESIRCTVTGCDWSHTITTTDKANGDPVNIWVEHAKAVR